MCIVKMENPMSVTLLLDYRDKGFDLEDKRYEQGDKGIKKGRKGYRIRI
jgi:hypothetical protein